MSTSVLQRMVWFFVPAALSSLPTLPSLSRHVAPLSPRLLLRIHQMSRVARYPRRARHRINEDADDRAGQSD